MTGDEALAKLLAIKARQDNPNRHRGWEDDHVEADQVLTDLLHALGLKELVETFESIRKWYS